MSGVEIKQERGWKRYPTYKDSGVEWLGEIPEGWKMVRLKYVAPVSSVRLTQKPDHLPYLGLEHIESKTGRLLLDTPVENVESTVSCFEKGDVLFGKLRPYLAKVFLAEFQGVSTTELLALKTSQEVNGKFLFYELIAEGFIDQVNSFTYGTKMPRVSPEQITSLFITLPPLSEQQAIARFLDRETAKIDTLIAKKERLIELLKEKRTALISHAVTKGLNPDAPMKDSGIEWLGKIPEGWKMIRLKYVAPVSSVKLTQKPDHLPYLGLEHIESKTGRLLLDTPVENVESTVSCFEKGDVLFGKLRPYLAKVFLAEFQGVSTTELLALKTSQEVNGKFLFYQLIAEGFINQVNSFTYGTKMPRVSPEQITSLFITLPPLSEQQAIAQFLDRETAKIDTLVTKTRISIDKLKEYRTALISAAVTGKIDIRENLTPSPN
ncbi:restriction endonuclease subunit S [Cylindrospermopsis raciborskii]|uniref:restriction endonuclease subunit S n=1 Tax=Cylindrospermopsis raciborskii TaxID=77022 RepID=UPI0011421EA7|nr:restriction endonuclease subunit S [Cylindrospermopsis raciborskii]TPX28998.1 restriction endonuclease subunit S [Cylindrospermopsis raciborskii GIHE 2018]